MKLNRDKRAGWLWTAREAVRGLCGGFCEPCHAVWVVEAWQRHRSMTDCRRLNQIQQAWLDVAGLEGAQVELIQVMHWQGEIGAGKLRSKVDGPMARKKHAARWARATYRVPEEMKLKYDVTDAMAMAAVWIQKQRIAAATLPLGR